jgi:hypothetical protein
MLRPRCRTLKALSCSDPYRRRKPVPSASFDARRFARADQRLAVRGAWFAGDRDPGAHQTLHPDRFTDKHARTVQRAVEQWRAEQAHRIVAEAAITIGSVAVRRQLEDTAARPPRVHRTPPFGLRGHPAPLATRQSSVTSAGEAIGRSTFICRPTPVSRRSYSRSKRIETACRLIEPGDPGGADLPLSVGKPAEGSSAS